MKFFLKAATIAASTLIATSASATVVGGAITGGSSLTQNGVFEKLDPAAGFNPGNKVGNDTFQTPNLYAFDEGQNIVIPATIAVNVGTSPVAGDTVASHYVFFDPKGSTSQKGYVDFDAEIYGIATQTSTLAASDFLALASVDYLNPGLRGLESGDSATIDPNNAMRLLVDWTASSPGDYIRVFTKRSPSVPTVPVPAGAPLLLAALGGLGLMKRRRRS